MRNDLDIFMAPRSVAIVGASRKTGKGSFNVIENMESFGYAGEIFPVNPLAKEVLGRKCYAEIKDIGRAVDLALISTPREQIPSIVEDCAEAGIRGAIVIPQGFADADAEGKDLQNRLTEVSRRKKIRILGPNTLGVMDAFSGFTSSFMPLQRAKGPVGVVCQSGIFFVGSSLFTGQMGKGIDLGNACDIDFADAVEYFGEDDDIRIIFLHIEGMTNGQRFLDVARRVVRKKPIIALKTARSPEGAEAASSHSGALVGEAEVFDAVFRQAGIVPAQDAEEVFDYTRAFLHLPPMKGKRVGLVTFTGAGGIILLDAFEASGLEPARLTSRTIQKVKDLSPPWMPIGNPLDIWPALMKNGINEVYRTVLSEVLRDPEVDGVICIALAPELPQDAHLDCTEVIRKTTEAGPEKPVVAWLYGPNQQEVSQGLEKGGHVLSLPSLPRAARTLSALYNREQFLSASSEPAPRFHVKGEIGEAVDRHGRSGYGEWMESRAYDLVERYGIPVVPQRLCRDAEAALDGAQDLGYPVAVKVLSPHVSHKTEVGGVALRVDGPEKLKETLQSMTDDVMRAVPEARIAGFLVQKMADPGAEVILGAKRDPQFGPTVIFGTGGIYAELWKDISYRVAPITRRDAGDMIRETRCYEILKGMRGRREYDLQFVEECLLRLSQLMVDLEDVREVDINPLVVFREGGAAVDVRVVQKGLGS